MAIGLAIGMPLGIPLWLSTKNPGLIGAGVAIGAGIGGVLEKKYNSNPREPTPEETRNRRIATFAGVLVLLAGVVAFLYMMLV